MIDNLLTREEAAIAMLKGEKCETRHGGAWHPTVVDDFDGTYCKFRIPPEPRREALVFENIVQLRTAIGSIIELSPSMRLREVMADEVVVVRRMTEDEVREFVESIFTKPENRTAGTETVRALGLIREGGES